VAITAPGGRPDRYGHCFGPLQGGGEVVGKDQPAGLNVVGHQLVEPRLVDRHMAGTQPLELDGVDFHHGHFGTKLGEASARDEAHIAAANHCDMHA
jgi:hypothetical protein